MSKRVGILTAGGDSPGLNAAIRGVGKSIQGHYGMQMIGFRDGFRGLMENRSMRLDGDRLSGILTLGGTILGTSRDKPHRMLVDGKPTDMTETIIRSYRENRLDVLICLGGGGTQKNALHLKQHGLNIIKPCPRPSITMWCAPTPPLVSTPPSVSPPRPSIACTVPLTVITVSSWWRSWGTVPVGWRWAPVLPAVPT